jgi:hypothetical protein
MSDYNTGNPVPSIDPRDLDDNATVFDQLLNGDQPSYLDRLNVPRKSWHQMEIDAAALVSPNVAALAGLTGANNTGFYFTGSGTMATFTFNAQGRSLVGAASQSAARAVIGAVGSADNITGSAAKLTTARSIAATGDGTWSVSFDGSANATAAFTLAASGVGAGTYGSVTVNVKGLVTAATAATPIANGGTEATTALAAGTNLGTSTVGTNTDQLARSSMIQAEIANKRAWTAYTPTITALTGTFTSVTATGSYMVAFGICFFRVLITVTTVGTGVKPIFTLPFAALADAINAPFPAFETNVNGKTGVAFIRSGLTTAETRDYANADLITANGCGIRVAGSYPIA